MVRDRAVKRTTAVAVRQAGVVLVQVLQQEGDAVQRTGGQTFPDASPGVVEPRVDQRIQFRVDALGTGNRLFEYLRCGEFSQGNASGEVRGIKVGVVFYHHRIPSRGSSFEA